MTGHATVAEAMTRDPLTFRPDTAIGNAVSSMLSHKVSGAPVLDAAGALAGVITAKDCFRAALHASYHQEWSRTVGDYMTDRVETLDAETDLVTAAQRFMERDFRRFPVTSDGRLVGIVTRLDLLRALHAHWSYAPGPRGGA